MTSPVGTEWISVPASGGACFDAYLATPPAGKGPGLVLFQEIFGVNEHIRTVAEQYALNGFVVLAPDVFWRSKRRVDLGYESADRQCGLQFAGALNAEETGLDTVATISALRECAAVEGRKVGAIGYCMGGRLAFLAAATASIDAAVAYYGGGIHDQLDKAPSIECPVQFHYAEHDDHVPLSAIDKVRAAMKDKQAEVHVYAGAMHGFNCWARASYHAASAALAHGRSLQFLSANLF